MLQIDWVTSIKKVQSAYSISYCSFLGELKEEKKLDKKDQSSVGNESKQTDGKDNILLYFVTNFYMRSIVS